ncbi:MAG: tetratricopeptide repeat protein, partial [Alphaproteobacteria bacterium]|nr:tetratricopeptide repeat protein [Alphaproteobacteria bacterium]
MASLKSRQVQRRSPQTTASRPGKWRAWLAQTCGSSTPGGSRICGMVAPPNRTMIGESKHTGSRATSMSNRQQRRMQEKSIRRQRSAGGGPPPLVTRDNLPSVLQAAIRYHQEDRLREAEALYRQILEVDGASIGALSGLGMVAHQAGRHEEALELIRRAIGLGASEAGFFMNLGAVCVKAGRPDEAEDAFREAIAREPRYGDPYYDLGNLFLAQGRPDDAIVVFDACMAARGRDFHALAYQAHAFAEAGRTAEAGRLLDFDTYVKTYPFEPPEGFADGESFRKGLGRYVKTHPTLRGNVMSTENGRHTGELIKPPLGPMEGMVKRIDEAVRWYKAQLPDDPGHPAVRWAPDRWRLTAWGVVMHNRGHERPHIHPNGWLSGVFYLQLPPVIDDPA